MDKVKYSVDEIAAVLDVSYTTALNLIRSGKLIGRKFGGRWFVFTDELQRFLKEGNHPDSIEEINDKEEEHESSSN